MGRRRRTASAPAPKSDVELVKERAAAVLATRSDAEARVRMLEERLARLDRWVNPATGLGTLEDKTRAAHFEFPFRLMDQEITSLVSGNPLAAKIVEKRPAEMFRQGYMLTAKAKGGSGAQGGADKSQIEDLQAYAERLNLDLRMRQGMTYGRQYGGSLLLLGIQDGRQPWQPVDYENIQSIRFINQIDRRFAYVQSYYSDYMRPKYGEAQTYLVANGVATSSYRSRDNETFKYRRASRGKLQADGYSVLTIHESRVIRWDGIEPDVLTRQTLAGWSWSVLQRIYETLRLCDGSFEALCYLISDASQGVIKLKGLFEAMSSGNEDKMQTRLQMIEDMRSVMRSIALDTDGGEDFTRVTTPLTGIPDSIDRIMQWLAAACDMPVTELFGISPAGLNATGESDRIKWYDTIKVEQKNYLSPKLQHLYRLISLAHDSPFRGRETKFDITFHSLYAPTDSELAKTRLTNAQRDQIYATIEAATPEEIKLTLTEIYPSIDPEEIEQEIEAKTKFDPYEKDPIESATAQNKVAQQQAMAKTKALHAAAKAKLASQPTAGAEGNSVPEGQSPTVPLPAGQVKTNTKTPANAQQQKSDAAGSKADQVHAQLSEDFPPHAIGWVKGVKWRGPVRVPLDKVDFSGKAKWQASREPDRVAMHNNRIAKGREKPVVLVQRPGDEKYPVTDGHHRSLAYLQRKEPVLAYIGKVHSAEGPWDEMHSSQKEGGFEQSAQLPRSDGASRKERFVSTGEDFDVEPPGRKDYSDDQPRDEQGRFGSGGGSSSSSGAKSTAPKAVPIKDYKAAHEAATEYFGPQGSANRDAITGYTSGDSIDLNHVLSIGHEAAVKEWGKEGIVDHQEKKAEILRRALADAPKFDGAVERGAYLHKADFDEMKPGAVITNRSFWSATMDHFTAASFGTGHPKDATRQQAILHIEQHAGVAIEGVSSFADEKEVLMPPGVRFQVLKVEPHFTTPGQSLEAAPFHDVYLRQVDDKTDGGRRDFDPGEDRDESGKWTSGGGSSASGRPAAEYRKQTDPRFKALKHIAGVLRSVPRALGRAVVDEVKEKIEDAKGAYHGVQHFLTGQPVSDEEKKAIKHVVLTVAAGVLASHLTPLLHLSGIFGDQAGEWAEKVTDQCLHHVVEKFSKRALRLDAANANADPTEWLAEQITQAIADALDQAHDELPLEAPRADFDPDQERDESGRWTSGGGGGATHAPKSQEKAAATLSPKSLQTEKQPFNTYNPPTPERSAGAELAAEEKQLEDEQASDEEFYANVGALAGQPGENSHGIHVADAKTFHDAFEHAFTTGPSAEYTHFVSHYTPEELGHMTTMLTSDGKAGIAIKDHGDGRVEGTALFNSGSAKGAGVDLLKKAIIAGGVNYLECYGEGLRKLYESVGFKVESTSAFNPDYAAPGWNYEKHGRPNYYTLRLQ